MVDHDRRRECSTVRCRTSDCQLARHDAAGIGAADRLDAPGSTMTSSRIVQPSPSSSQPGAEADAAVAEGALVLHRQRVELGDDVVGRLRTSAGAASIVVAWSSRVAATTGGSMRRCRGVTGSGHEGGARDDARRSWWSSGTVASRRVDLTVQERRAPSTPTQDDGEHDRRGPPPSAATTPRRRGAARRRNLQGLLSPSACPHSWPRPRR